MYKINDLLLYKGDVCKVSDITTIHDNKYYVLTPINDESLTIKVPVTSEDKLLKNIMSREDANKLISEIGDVEIINGNEHSIENEYKHLLSTGDKKDLIKIIKTTYLRNKNRLDNGKKIGERDSNYFELAEKILYTEIAVSLGLSFDDAKEYIINKMKEDKYA